MSLQLCDCSLFSPVLCSGMCVGISLWNLKKLLETTEKSPKKKLLDFALYNMSNGCHNHGSGLVLVSNTDYAPVFVRQLIPLRSPAIQLAWPFPAGVAFTGSVFVCRLFALRPPASAVACLLFYGRIVLRAPPSTCVCMGLV